MVQPIMPKAERVLLASGDPLDKVTYQDVPLDGLQVPTHTVEAFRGKDGEWYWRKFEISTGKNVGHDGDFGSPLAALREAAESNPEIEIFTINRASLWTPEQLKRRLKHKQVAAERERARIEARDKAQGNAR